MRPRMTTRRAVLSASSGLIGAAALGMPMLGNALVRPTTPGLKLGSPAPWKPTDDDLKFYQQIGADYVYAAAPNTSSVAELQALRARYAQAGITLHNVRWFSGAPSGGSKHMATILLNLPGRDESLEQCKIWVRNYGMAGFNYTIATLSITGVWSSNWARGEAKPGDPMTRGVVTRSFDEDDPNLHNDQTGSNRNTLLYGRVYSEEEVLENYQYFCKQIGPVAEEHGVCIGFHPDDPPAIKSFGGVARFNGTFAQIDRNLKIANSPNLGMTFCLGVWLEGGARMGMDPIAAIKKWVPTKKVWNINFRNVTAPMPRFMESWMDNGYYDMYPFMKALVETNYDGFVEQDHTLPIVGSPYAYHAYAMAYMKALHQRALHELHRT